MWMQMWPVVTHFWSLCMCGLALHFTMRILRKGNSNTKDRVQKKVAKFVHHKISPNWESLASRRKVSCLCALYNAFCGERAWKDIGDSLKRPHYLSRVDHVRKIRTRRQRTDIGKYSFVNRTIRDWNQLPAEVLQTLPCKPSTFRKRPRKVTTKCIKGHK